MNVGYHSAIQRGRLIRAAYANYLPVLAKRRIRQQIALPLSVYAFSCQRDLPEQVASIRSFLWHVGIPEHFTVISDGSYGCISSDVLRSIHPSVRVVQYQEFIQRDLPECVSRFAERHIMGKKLAVEMSLPISGTGATIFTDCDVLFLRGGKLLADHVLSGQRQAWYLPDVRPALDPRLLRDISEAECPVNAGFMVLKRPLDWTLALERLAQLTEEPIGDTEQTSVHFAMHSVGAEPLNTEKFVLKLDDQVYYIDWYRQKDIALRHYVNPVRHKMWSHLPH